MNTLAPKDIFQQSCKSDAETLANTINQPWMRTAMIYAVSQLSLSGASEQEIAGARKFITTLINLSETQKPEPAYPSKELQNP